MALRQRRSLEKRRNGTATDRSSDLGPPRTLDIAVQASVPEPAGLALLGAGLAVFWLRERRKSAVKRA